MLNSPHKKPGEDELGISRVLKEPLDDNSKKSSYREGTNKDPLKRKSREFGAKADLKENIDPDSKRRKLEDRESSDRISRGGSKDVQDGLSSKRRRPEKVKKVDTGYSDDFYTNVEIISRFGKEAKSGLEYIKEHNKLPPLKDTEK